MIDEIKLTEGQENEMRRVKKYFPYRIVIGVLLPNGEFSVFANATRARASNYIRKNPGAMSWEL